VHVYLLVSVPVCITNAAGALLVVPFFESENAFTFHRTFHPIRLLLDELPYSAPMAPPLPRQSEFQEFTLDAIDYKTVSRRFLFVDWANSPHLNGSLLVKMCLTLGGGPNRYRCYVLKTQSL